MSTVDAAAPGAEVPAADVRMLIGNGFVPEYAESALDLVYAGRALPGAKRF
jgi:hypothetical protein